TASPVSFPARVLALVEGIYVDVYGTQTKPILSLDGDLPELLAQHGVPPTRATPYVTPAPSSTMLIRSSRNILTSVHFNTTPRNLTRTAVYLSIAVHVMFASQHALVDTMLNHADPVDCATCLPQALAPALEEGVRDELIELCQKVMRKEAVSLDVFKRRTDP